MKTIKAFGKSIPIVAIMLVLMAGIASAALFAHYATLNGDIKVVSAVRVSDSFGTLIDIDGIGGLNFSSPATFEIHNYGDTPVMVELKTKIMDSSAVEVDYVGFNIEQSLIPGHSGFAIVPPGGVVGTVEMTHSPFVVPDTYTVVMEFDPDIAGAEDYHDYMTELILTHKEDFGVGGTWNPIGDISTLEFAAMGNMFYYELNATELESDDTYAIIYYADQIDRFVNWGGVAPGVIDTFLTDADGNYVDTGCVELNMNMPSASDINHPGAKIWIVPTSALTGDTELPMDEWNPSEYLFENDVLTQYTDTNIV